MKHFQAFDRWTFTAIGVGAALVTAGSALAQQLPPAPVSVPPVVGLHYDSQGNLKRFVQAPGTGEVTTTHSYDRLNRHFETIDARNKATRLQYNGRDQIIGVTDPRSLVTQYPTNGLGGMTSLVSPDTGVAGHTFDAAGNIQTRLDSRGVLETFEYDSRNRLRSLAFTATGQPTHLHSWTYDQTGQGFSHGIGRLTSTQYPGGSATYAYDPKGRLTSTTQVSVGAATASLTTGYSYDQAGRVLTVTYPSGRVLSIQRNGGLPVGMSLTAGGAAPSVPLISAAVFEPSPGGEGLLRSWKWHLQSGVLPHQREFDSWGRMIRYPFSGAIRDIHYDAKDRITAYTHLESFSGASSPAVQALNQAFGYDELGRLTSIGTSVDNWSIAYDDNGNRRSVSTSGAVGTGTRNHATASNSNRLTSLDSPPRTFQHDAAGNTFSDLQAQRGWTATYNLPGRMSRLNSSPDGVNVFLTDYVYNVAGQRVATVPVSGSCVGPATCPATTVVRQSVVFVYDQDGLLLGEYTSSGSPLREYVWLQGIPLAVIDGSSGNEAIYYIYTDHLNTPRTVIDRAGQQRWTWLAEPFGNSAPVTNPVGFGEFMLNLRMPGQYHDTESGLLYNFHRMYDSSKGRYTQSDPTGLAGGINTYSYAFGNPLSFTDPDGLLPKKYEKPKNPNKQTPPLHRQQSGERERNVGHENAEEHSKRTKGQRGTRGARGARGIGPLFLWDLLNEICSEQPGAAECRGMHSPPEPDC